jgi:hypothetical protein
MGGGPSGSQNLGGPVRSRRDAGMGTASSGACPWRPRTGVATWQSAVVWSSPRASGPSKRPRRRPPPTPQTPSVSPSPSSAWQPAGWPGRPTPRRPAALRQAGGRDGGAARRAAGALLCSTLRWQPSAPPKSGRGEAVRRRPRPPRGRSALASGCTQRPCSPLRTRMGGRSWPPHCGQKRGRMSRGSRRIRNTIARWHLACAGASIPPRSVPGAWRNPHGWRPGPCSRSWGCSWMR